MFWLAKYREWGYVLANNTHRKSCYYILMFFVGMGLLSPILAIETKRNGMITYLEGLFTHQKYTTLRDPLKPTTTIATKATIATKGYWLYFSPVVEIFDVWMLRIVILKKHYVSLVNLKKVVFDYCINVLSCGILSPYDLCVYVCLSIWYMQGIICRNADWGGRLFSEYCSEQ